MKDQLPPPPEEIVVDLSTPVKVEKTRPFCPTCGAGIEYADGDLCLICGSYIDERLPIIK